MAIPWKTLLFNPSRDGQRWGMNLLRRVRGKNEDSYWAPVDRRNPVHRISKAGYLEGLSGMRPGRNLTVKPFLLGTSASDSQGLIAEHEGQERVNLTRLQLFFEEKRDFFVENSNSFVLCDVSERNYRQGSSTSNFGRVSGRAGVFDLGALNMQTEAFDSAPAENFAVFRMRRNLGASDVGVMFLNRESTGRLDTGDYNRTFAVDANLVFLGNLIVNSYLAQTDDPNLTGDQTAARVQLSWRDQIWDASAFVKHVGDAFDPEMGYVRREAVRHGYAPFGTHPRTKWPLVQEINPCGLDIPLGDYWSGSRT